MYEARFAVFVLAYVNVTGSKFSLEMHAGETETLQISMGTPYVL